MLKHRTWTWGLTSMVVLLTLVFPAVTLAAGGPPPGRGQGNGSGVAPALPPTGSALDAAEQAALVEALNEEYGALALYQSVIAQYGEVQPFTSIARSEQTHVDALLTLFARYGLEAPAAPAFSLPTFATLDAACAAGVEAEIADAALYDQLSPLFDAPDVLQVFDNLQSASLNQHLPAFQTCVEGGTYTGSASGNRMGQMQRGNGTAMGTPAGAMQGSARMTDNGAALSQQLREKVQLGRSKI